MTNLSSSQPLEPDEQGRPDSSGHALTKDSVASGFSKSKGARKKRLRIPVSIEDLFNKPSTQTAANINPPPGKAVLTPRSAESCLKLGVNPEIIKIRDIDSFWESGIDPSVQRMRHEAYVQRRYEVMKQLRTERKKLAHIAECADSKGAAAATSTGMTPDMVLKQQQEQNSSILDMERKRIQKMKERQERELEQMLQYEVSRAKMQQEMEKRIQLAKKKEDMRKKQQQKRLKLMAEENRLREMQKVAMEEAEEAKRRGLARAMYEREQKAIAEQRAKEAADVAHAQEMEAERKRKQEEHRLQVARFFSEEQAKLRERMETMNEAEARKQKAIEDSQQRKKLELRKKREMVEKRIERNMEMAAAVEAKRKQDFMDKQDKHELIREAHLSEMEKSQQLHLREIEMQEQRRRMIILQQRREEERKKETMLQKFDEDEKHVETIKDMHMHEQKLIKERKMLQIQMKAENVERVKRMAEYKRLNTLKKIEDNDHRTKSMVEQREQLIAQRRETSIKTKKQKEDISALMDGVRTDATKANKIISMALSGKVDLAELASPKKGKKKRSKSSNGRSRTTLKLLGPQGTQSSSAGDAHQQSGSMDGFKPHDNFDDGQPNPSRYISPYETGNGSGGGGGGGGQKVTL